MFDQCQVYLNNVVVENTNKCCAHRAYFENLLCYNKESKDNLLRGDFFFHEKKKEEVFTKDSKQTKEFAIQAAATPATLTYGAITTPAVLTKAKSFEAYGKIHCDIFNINKYMLNNVDIKLVFSNSSPNCCLIGNAPAVFRIKDTFLSVRRVKISNAVMLAHAMALERTTAKYPIKRVLVKPFVIPSLSNIFTISGIHFGIMPTRVVLGFV